MEVAVASAAGGGAGGAEAGGTGSAALTAPAGAGSALTSVPAGPDWASGFKDEVKSYVAQKAFKTAEDMAVGYQNLEKLKGVPEERLLKLPEKMEGAEARAVFERLGAPKEAKGYELPTDGAVDKPFLLSAQDAFFKNNLTKAQAQGVAAAFNEYASAQMSLQAEARKNALSQADETLKKEWGQHYDTNINLAKQGARVLGLDAKTLDLIEASQGREVLFKNLQKIGVGVGESSFVDGGTAGSAAAKTPEQAAAEMKNLMQDRKFAKKVMRGDLEATKIWNDLNMAAAPGQKQIG